MPQQRAGRSRLARLASGDNRYLEVLGSLNQPEDQVAPERTVVRVCCLWARDEDLGDALAVRELDDGVHRVLAGEHARVHAQVACEGQMVLDRLARAGGQAAQVARRTDDNGEALGLEVVRHASATAMPMSATP